MTKIRINSKSDSQKSTLCSLYSYLVFWKNLSISFIGQLSFSVVSFVSSCGIRMVGLFDFCRLFGFCEGYGYA